MAQQKTKVRQEFGQNFERSIDDAFPQWYQ